MQIIYFQSGHRNWGCVWRGVRGVRVGCKFDTDTFSSYYDEFVSLDITNVLSPVTFMSSGWFSFHMQVRLHKILTSANCVFPPPQTRTHTWPVSFATPMGIPIKPKLTPAKRRSSLKKVEKWSQIMLFFSSFSWATCNGHFGFVFAHSCAWWNASLSASNA